MVETSGLFVGTHPDCEPRSRSSTKESAGCGRLEVRWLATGNVVCSVEAMPAMTISQVKQAVREHAGIPVEDQRLHLGSRELSGSAQLSGGEAEPLWLVRSVTDPRITNLGHFRPHIDFTAAPKGAFTSVRKLASGIQGDIYQYRWQQAERTEETVAVKRLRVDRLQAVSGTETDERVVHLGMAKRAPEAEDALTEIGVLSYLSRQADACPYILRMRGVFAEESSVLLVTDFADGGDLFDVAASGRVPEAKLKRHMFQLITAVEYLHRHRIGHRDISLENVLVKDGNLRLMDFGMSVSSHSPSGVPLRFFRAVGKDSYRAPEVYVPGTAQIRVSMPSGCKAGGVAMVQARSTGQLCEVRFPEEAVPGQQCMAEVWGYGAQPADLFSCGVSCFMLAWQCPPWNRAKLSDTMFSFVHSKGSKGVEGLLQHWKKPLLSQDAMSFLRDLLQSDPAKRPTAAECLEGSWLAPEAVISL